MPCMGPSWDDKLPADITAYILKKLKKKFKINNNGLHEKNHELDFDDELKTKLLKVIEEIVQSDAFNGW